MTKKAVTRVVTLCALGAGTLLNSVGAEAQDFSQAYRYTNKVVVSNPGAKLTSYAVALNLTTSGLVQDGELTSDARDLRFFDSNGTRIQHWVEGDPSTQTGKIWVLLPDIPANGSVELTMLSGHSGAENLANVEGMFALWDDFEGATPSGLWEKGCGTATLTQADGKGTFAWQSSGLFLAQKGGPNNDGTFPTANDYALEVFVSEYEGRLRTLAWVNPDNKLYSVSMGTASGATAQTAMLTRSGSSAGLCDAPDYFGVEYPFAEFPNGVYSLSWSSAGQRLDMPEGSRSSNDTTLARGNAQRVAIGGTAGTGSLTLDWARVRRIRPGAEPSANVTGQPERELTAPSITDTNPTSNTLELTFNYQPVDDWARTKSFTATCGDKSVTGTASPLRVTGLTGGTDYVCSVTVTTELDEIIVSRTLSTNTFPGSDSEGGDGDGDGDSSGGDGDGDSTGGDGDGTGGDGNGDDGDGDGDGTGGDGDGGAKSSGGSGCSAVPGATSGGALALLFGLAAACVRRRKPKTA